MCIVLGFAELKSKLGEAGKARLIWEAIGDLLKCPVECVGI
jgi:hypothetical protein